ncbi:MAG: hypothetical protein KDJ68_04780 [Rhodobiaceae bacterium]|nr:hypothetical protein [Rhodobiaceae bacterium]
MSRTARAAVFAVAGYFAGAMAGLALVSMFSGNGHDKSMEMVMTAAFFTGPVGAVIGLLAGLRQPAEPGATDES